MEQPENDIKDRPSCLKRLFHFGSRYIDYRMAIAGATVMSVIVFTVNYSGTGNLPWSLVAAAKQGAYTFFFGGFIMRTCERLAVRIRKPFPALLAATLIPAVMAITFTFMVHSLKGTPRPVASTIPTALLIVPSTLLWGIRKRRQQNGAHTNCAA